MTQDPRERSEKVLRLGAILLSVFFVVGAVSLLVSNPFQGLSLGVGSDEPRVDYKAQVRASNQAKRVEQSLAAWANNVNRACNDVGGNAGAMKYGTDANVGDTRDSVTALVRAIENVLPPGQPQALEKVAPVKTAGSELTGLWIEVGGRTEAEVSDQEEAAAVDKARAYVQDLIDRGATDCASLLPAPNPPLEPAAPVVPAPVP